MSVDCGIDAADLLLEHACCLQKVPGRKMVLLGKRVKIRDSLSGFL